MTKYELFDNLKGIKTSMDIPSDFKCLGPIDEVYPDLPQEVLDCYYTWIWENSDKVRIATSDYGNSYLGFLCEGTPEELIKHLPIK